MKFKLIFALAGTALSLLFSSCSKETTTFDCTGVSVTYTNDIKAIMDSRCATSGCHDAITRERGYDLSSYSGVKSSAGNSAFMGSIQHLSGFNAMPQGSSKLSTSSIQKIYCWIQNGKPL